MLKIKVETELLRLHTIKQVGDSEKANHASVDNFSKTDGIQGKMLIKRA